MRVIKFVLLSISVTLLLALTTTAQQATAKSTQTPIPTYCWTSEHIGYCKILCPKSIRYIRPYPLSNGKETIFVWPLSKETACNDTLLNIEIQGILNSMKKRSKLEPVASKLI